MIGNYIVVCVYVCVCLYLWKYCYILLNMIIKMSEDDNTDANDV